MATTGRNKEKLILHKIKEELMISIYQITPQRMVKDYKPDQLQYLLLNTIESDGLIAYVYHMQDYFIEVEAYEFCIVTKEFLKNKGD